MAEKRSSLHQFHPLVRQWFKERFGKPTDIQEKSWPKIAMGEHVLISAPTGSGKTLTAFLWAVDQLITGRYPTGHTSILYISPLKALNNDIQRNLVKPLEELRRIFDRVKEPFPPTNRAISRRNRCPLSSDPSAKTIGVGTHCPGYQKYN